MTIYDPEKTWDGYTLAFFQRRIPILIDMNGRVVHSWPAARAKSRLRLLPDGSLLTISLGRAIYEYDWDGNLVWQREIKREIPHHDVVRMANGNTMMVLRRKGRSTDRLVELDRRGDIVWQWQAGRFLRPYFPEEIRVRGDITHINSVQELPPNRWFDEGDERFRPGNLLISPRNLNAIFVIDKTTGEVVWSYDRRLDMQHEALMIEPGFERAGSILIFNNGFRSTWEYRASSVIEIDPSTGEVTWEFRQDGFYSPTGGLEQPLPNGNVLISSSRGGRAFEVTRQGEVVWQWAPPFNPNRPQRVAWDHTPQLAAMARPEPIAVRPPKGYRHVDPAVHQFSRRGARRRINVNGQNRPILTDNQACRELFLPTEPRLEVHYGLNRTALRRDGVEPFAVTFALRLTPRGGEPAELMSDTVEPGSRHRRRGSVDLADHALRWVELCLSTEVAEPGPEAAAAVAATKLDEYVYWFEPQVLSGSAPSRPPASEAGREILEDDLTAEELEVQKEHLRALGYVD